MRSFQKKNRYTIVLLKWRLFRLFKIWNFCSQRSIAVGVTLFLHTLFFWARSLESRAQRYVYLNEFEGKGQALKERDSPQSCKKSWNAFLLKVSKHVFVRLKRAIGKIYKFSINTNTTNSEENYFAFIDKRGDQHLFDCSSRIFFCTDSFSLEIAEWMKLFNFESLTLRLNQCFCHWFHHPSKQPIIWHPILNLPTNDSHFQGKCFHGMSLNEWWKAEHMMPILFQGIRIRYMNRRKGEKFCTMLR